MLIGLTGPSSFTPECCEMIEEFFGANFVLLYHGRDSNLEYWLSRIDGMILAGGVDIHPTVYGESVWSNQNLSRFDIKRDNRELYAIEHCLNNKVPILGICRGHQLMGVRFGLPFVMDISNSEICHQGQSQKIVSNPKEPMHSVRIREANMFFGENSVYKMPDLIPERQIFRKVLKEPKKDRIWVNSFHHQAVAFMPKHDYAADNINVIGVNKIDLEHCKEIVELMDGPGWLSCQWHPEYDWKENTASRVVLNRYKFLLENA